jgi:hypothetical protein
MEKNSRFVTEKVYSIPGRGVVVTGKVESGSVSAGEEIGFLGTDGQWASAVVVGIEVSRRLVEEAAMGQQASLLLQGVRKEQISIGTILLEAPEAPMPVSSPLPQSSYQPEISVPSAPSLGHPIHPSSSLWRTIFFIAIGILILLAILYFQGVLDRYIPIKKIAGLQVSALSNEPSAFRNTTSTFENGSPIPFHWI